MKNLKYIMTFVLACCYLCPLSAHGKMDEATFKQIKRIITLQPDGTMEDRTIKEIVLHNHIAFNDLYGETFVVYNPEFQEVKINRIYTKQKDGTIIEMPENAYNEVLPSFAANAVAYNNLKELVITHTGLEIGATIYADYSVFTKSGFYPALDKIISINEEQPISNYTVEVTIPKSEKLSSQLINSNTKPIITNSGANTSYKWSFRNVKPRSGLPLTPTQGGDQTHIYLSTFKNKEQAFAVLQNQAKGEISATNIEHFKRWLPNGSITANAIIDAVNNHFELVKIPANMNGYAIRPMDAIFQSAYYTPLEKWYFMYAVASQLGVQLTPVVSIPAFLPTVYASLEAINSFFLLNETKPLDAPTVYSSTPNLQWWNISDGQNITPVSKNISVVNANYSVAIVGNKASVKQNATYNNRFETQNTDNTKKINLQKRGTLDQLILPIVYNEIKELNLNNLPSIRNSTLQINYLVNETDTYHITWADTQQCRTQVPNINMTNKVGSVKISSQRDNNSLTITRHIELNKTLITPAEYGDLRSLINAWNNINTTHLLFQ